MKIKGIAHRGHAGYFPENTLSSFEAACKLSFSHVELDTHLSKDGVPMVMHDSKVDRMCNGKGYLKDYTLKELKQFRVGNEETIPTLEEALNLLKGRTKVMLELKKVEDFYPSLEDTVFKVIQKLDMVGDVIISSFNHYALVKMRKISEDIQLSLIMGGISPSVFPFMKEIRAKYMSISKAYLIDDFVQVCADNQVQLIVRPIDTEENMKQTLRFPSVLVSTNDSERWKSFYEKYHV